MRARIVELSGAICELKPSAGWAAAGATRASKASGRESTPRSFADRPAGCSQIAHGLERRAPQRAQHADARDHDGAQRERADDREIAPGDRR